MKKLNIVLLILLFSIRVFSQTASISSQTNVSCSGYCDGSLTVTVTGGNSPYSYVWSSGAITQTATGLCAGTYIVTVTDSGSLTSTATATITSPSSIVASLITTDASCFGMCDGSIQCMASGGTPAYTYLWENTSTSQINFGLCAGTYLVTITDSQGCSITQSANVTSPAQMNITASNSGPVCAGTDIQLISNGGVSYFWSGPNGYTSSLQNPIIVASTPVNSGIYTVSVTSASGCTESTSTSVIVSNPLANAGSDQTISSGAQATLTASATGGSGTYTYSWSSGDNTQTTIVSPTSTTTYTLTVADTYGCLSTDQVVVNVSTGFFANPTASSTTICEGEPVSLNANASGGSGTYTYTWSPPLTLDNAYIANPVASPTVSTTYFVTVNDGSTDAIGSITITVNPIPPTVASNTGPYCEGATIMLSAVNGVSFVWSGPEGFTSTLMNPTILSSTSLMSGTYAVTATNPMGCTAVATTNVVVNEIPIAEAGTDAIFCSLAGILSANPTIGSAAWTVISGPGSANIMSVNSYNSIFTVDVEGTYVFQWITENNSCRDTDIVNMTLLLPPTISGTLSYSGGQIASGDAKVFLYVPEANGQHLLIDSVVVGAGGSFLFENLSEDFYYLHAKLINNSAYPNITDTYYDSSYQWTGASLIQLLCNTDTVVDINMYEMTPATTGNANISGTITVLSAKGGKATGEPVHGAEVFIEQEPNDQPVANTQTDTDGYYIVENLPDGVYSIYVDIPGFPLFETYSNINVTSTDTIFENLNFFVDTASATAGIYIDDFVSIPSQNKENWILSFYPNPVNDVLKITSYSEVNNASIEIIDLTGKVVNSYPFNSKEIVLDFSILNKGVYFVKVQSVNNVYLIKIVKE